MVLTGRDAVVSLIEDSRDVEIGKAMASGTESLPADSRKAPVKMLLAS